MLITLAAIVIFQAGAAPDTDVSLARETRLVNENNYYLTGVEF